MLELDRGPLKFEPPKAEDVYKSARVNAFLSTIIPGERFAFLDADQSIWPVNFDTEEIVLRQGGVIPNLEQWEKDLAIEPDPTQPNDYSLLVGRDITLSHFTPRVTPDITRLTNIPAETVMSNNVLRSIGRYVGFQLVDQGIIRPAALEVIKACMEQDVRVVILTATPLAIAQGVAEAVETALELDKSIFVLGRELSFDEEGRAKEEMFMFGPAKKEVVQEAKRRGAVALAGAGDKAYIGGSDEFVFDTQYPAVIDNKDHSKGNLGWEKLLVDLQQEFSTTSEVQLKT